jgi:hypothetical protein
MRKKRLENKRGWGERKKGLGEKRKCAKGKRLKDIRSFEHYQKFVVGKWKKKRRSDWIQYRKRFHEFIWNRWYWKNRNSNSRKLIIRNGFKIWKSLSWNLA